MTDITSWKGFIIKKKKNPHLVHEYPILSSLLIISMYETA